jgi:hypothetical protein
MAPRGTVRYFRLDKRTGERDEITRYEWCKAVAGEYGPHATSTWAHEWGHRIDIGWSEYETEEGQEMLDPQDPSKG